MMKKVVLFISCFLLYICVDAQSENGNQFTIDFSTEENFKQLTLDNNQAKEFQLERLKFYVGYISLYSKNKLQWADSSYFLVDFDKEGTKAIKLNIPDELLYDQVGFNVGVDSTTNISGAFEGDLDPINGMYWAWNTGYINTKIEGTWLQKEEKGDYKFHLGGYQAPNQTVNWISFAVPNDGHLSLTIDLPKFVSKINLENGNVVMSPGAEAVLLSSYFAKSIILSEK